MTQYLADLCQRCASTQHASCQRVPKLMRTVSWGTHMSSLERTADNRGYRGRDADTAPRRASAQEHPAAGRCVAAITQIRGDRLSDIVRQWQGPLLTSLAADMNAGVDPIYIFQLKEHDFPSTQSQSRQKQQDRLIAKSTWRAPALVLRQHAANSSERQSSWNRCHRPMGHCRNGFDPGSVDVATIMCETQNRANHDRQQAGTLGRSILPRFVQDKGADLLSRQVLQIRSPVGAGAVKEAACERNVYRSTRRGESALREQICRVLINQDVDLGPFVSPEGIGRYESGRLRSHEVLCARSSLISPGTWPRLNMRLNTS